MQLQHNESTEGFFVSFIYPVADPGWGGRKTGPHKNLTTPRVDIVL